MTLTQGTSLWAIQQMLEGKKVTAPYFTKPEFLCITKEKIYDEKDNEIDFSIFGIADTTWQLWPPPNPHTKGTFAWAWEEIQRGNKVKVCEPNYNEDSTYSFWQVKGLMMTCKYNAISINSPCDTIPVILINSTKWELA